jgi:hypothetical protein
MAGFTVGADRVDCRAWICFSPESVTASANMTGVRDSFNVSSVVDHGTGMYTINLTNDMGDTNYAAVMAGGRDSSNQSSLSQPEGSYARAAGTIRVHNTYNNDNLEDPNIACVAIFGN